MHQFVHDKGCTGHVTRGLKEEHMALIVDLIDQLLSDTDSQEILDQVKIKVNAIMKVFPLFAN